MESIQGILPKVLQETAVRYEQAQKEKYGKRHERFKARIGRIVTRQIKDAASWIILVVLIIFGILFLRSNKNGE